MTPLKPKPPPRLDAFQFRAVIDKINLLNSLKDSINQINIAFVVLMVARVTINQFSTNTRIVSWVNGILARTVAFFHRSPSPV
jgi:hypothetical protein